MSGETVEVVQNPFLAIKLLIEHLLTERGAVADRWMALLGDDEIELIALSAFVSSGLHELVSASSRSVGNADATLKDMTALALQLQRAVLPLTQSNANTEPNITSAKKIIESSWFELATQRPESYGPPLTRDELASLRFNCEEIRTQLANNSEVAGTSSESVLSHKLAESCLALEFAIDISLRLGAAFGIHSCCQRVAGTAAVLHVELGSSSVAGDVAKLLFRCLGLLITPVGAATAVGQSVADIRSRLGDQLTIKVDRPQLNPASEVSNGEAGSRPRQD